MSIMKLLQQAQGGQGLGQLASQLGLDASKADELTAMLAPAIGSAAKKRAESGGLQGILGALTGEGQAGLFDDASAAASSAGQSQGAAFLESLLGGSREAKGLADEAAKRANVEPSIVEQFLPALAAMAQGGLQKNMPDSSIQGMLAGLTGGAEQQKSGGGLMGMIGGLMGGKAAGGSSGGGMDLSMLNNLLDADGDGSALDDVLGKLMK